MRLAEAPAESAIPWLENGDRLNAVEFLRRYDAMPHGIQEYLVWLTADRAVHWFHLVDGMYTAKKPTGATLHSQVHPSLVLDVDALLAHDRPRLVAALESR